MASIQTKRGKSGKKTYYVVVPLAGKRKWIKAVSQTEAKALKREIEALADAERLEKLGIVGQEKRIDDFFEEYLKHVKLRCAPNTVKRYLPALNGFVAFVRLFHSHVRLLRQTI